MITSAVALFFGAIALSWVAYQWFKERKRLLDENAELKDENAELKARVKALTGDGPYRSEAAVPTAPSPPKASTGFLRLARPRVPYAPAPPGAPRSTPSPIIMVSPDDYTYVVTTVCSNCGERTRHKIAQPIPVKM